MTSRRLCANVNGVATPKLRTFTLVIDPQSDPIAGRLEDEGAFRREFVGWLGLAITLEQLLSASAADGEDHAEQ